MRATGIVRRIQDNGSIVIPKSLRKVLRLNSGDPVEFYFTDNSFVIGIGPYMPMKEDQNNKHIIQMVWESITKVFPKNQAQDYGLALVTPWETHVNYGACIPVMSQSYSDTCKRFELFADFDQNYTGNHSTNYLFGYPVYIQNIDDKTRYWHPIFDSNGEIIAAVVQETPKGADEVLPELCDLAAKTISHYRLT